MKYKIVVPNLFFIFVTGITLSDVRLSNSLLFVVSSSSARKLVKRLLQ